MRVIPAELIGTRIGGDTLAPQARPGARKDDDHRGVLGVCDPDLFPRNAIAVTRSHGLGLLVGCVGTGIGLRQREGTDRLAARERAQPAFALRISAGMRDHLGDERVGHRQRHRHRRAGACDGLDRQGVADVVLAEAAVHGRNGHAQQALVGRGVDHVGWKLTRLVDAGGALRDNLAGELRDLLLESFLF